MLHLLLQQRHQDFTGRAETSGGKAVQRQTAMAESYNRSMSSLLGLLNQLVQAPDQARQLLPQIEQLLHQMLPSRPLTIHGLLPYQSLKYAKRAPVLTPTLTPAYQQSTVTSVPADLAGSVEAPVSTLVAEQARSIATAAGRQNRDPAALYEWVQGENKLVAPGDVLGDAKIVENAADRLVLEQSGPDGTAVLNVQVADGRQQVRRLQQKPVKVQAVFAEPGVTSKQSGQ